jgi:uncharacterized protein (DUF2336 family)
MTSISPKTIAEFIEEPSWTERAKLIERIASHYLQDAYGLDEKRIAVDIFRVALYDGEPLVRRILAETLKHASELPQDIVTALVHDVADVATPFLEVSPLLTADDLTAVARDGSRGSPMQGPARSRTARPVPERSRVALIDVDAELDMLST